jgi:hypothetical protein
MVDFILYNHWHMIGESHFRNHDKKLQYIIITSSPLGMVITGSHQGLGPEARGCQVLTLALILCAAAAAGTAWQSRLRVHFALITSHDK